MDITWYGLSCFRIREGGVTVVCDPYDKSVGPALAKVRADIVTVSHDRAGHNAVERVTGEPKVLTGPGEYEVKNVFITGVDDLSPAHGWPSAGAQCRLFL
jgi:L-ascorbate metabolism protein UlaG (beta-lactamase superfamily)